MEDEYGRLPEGFKKPRVPLFYTLNWNGNFLDELIHLRYSVSAAEQAQGKYMYSVFTGQSIEAGPVYAYFDVMYSRGKLDPLGLLTELTQPKSPERRNRNHRFVCKTSIIFRWWGKYSIVSIPNGNYSRKECMKAHRSIKPTMLTRKVNTVRHGGIKEGLSSIRWPMIIYNLLDRHR